MTEEQIIKAFKRCIDRENCEEVSCEICPYNKVYDCKEVMLQNVLDVLNCQKAKNEDLKKENEALKTNYQSMCISLSNMAKAERREAIKEFWNKLKLKSRTTYMRYKEIEYAINYIEIAEGDCLVKEMTEGK